MLIVVSITLSALFGIQGCKKSVGPFDPSGATFVYTMKGQVVDAKTNAGIPAATVKVFDNILTSDANGFFTFKVSYSKSFPFSIMAEAPNYLVSSSLINGPAQVRAIRLTVENPGVVINPQGGSITANSTESVAGQSFKLTFPSGSLAQAEAISFTPMEDFYFMYGNVTKSTSSLIDLATVSVAPEGMTFQKAVTMYVPLPFTTDKDSRFTLLKFDQATNSWVNTGKELVVDDTKTGGTVEITQSGIYSVAGEGSFTEVKQSESFLYDYECGDAPVLWQATMDYTSGVPAGVSETWLKNTFSHNTIIGGHVSFLKQTSTMVRCESYQPGSSYPVPGDEMNYPAPPVCPSGASPILITNGVSMNNRVINGVVSFRTITNGTPVNTPVPSLAHVNVPIQSYSWQCLHDQGGGK